MSFLWNQGANKQLITIQNRPSPKHNNHILEFVHGKKSPFTFMCSDSIERISLFISRKGRVKASMTIEAALVLPLFVFFFLNLCSSIEMIRLHGNLQLALWEVGNRMSIYGCLLSDGDDIGASDPNREMTQAETEGDTWWNELAGIVWSYTYVKAQIAEYLGEDYLETSPLTYGIDGLQFLESNVLESKDCFDVVVTYSVAPLSNASAFLPFRMSNRYYGHLWNGYEIPKVKELVYMAENGVVYHTSKDCTHLKLSIQQVNWQEVGNCRNERGQKYLACEKCCNHLASASVYITEEGNRYHYLSGCPGLKRTIICMTLSEAEQMRLCLRCAEKKQ